MKWKSTSILVIASLIVFSCSIEYKIVRKENKLIGAWAFEKVFYKENGALFRDNVTRDFAGDVIEFFGDYSALYDDASLGSLFDGWWEILLDDDSYYDDDGSNRDLEFFLDMCFDDFIAREEFCYFGSICRVNQNKLVIESLDRFGSWTFKLRRI